MPDVRLLQTSDEIQNDLVNAGLGLENLYGSSGATPTNGATKTTDGGLEPTQTQPSISDSTLTPRIQAPTPSTPVAQPASNIIDIGQYKPDVDVSGAYSYILQPPAEKTRKGFQTLSDLTSRFSQQAEPFRSFENIGGEDIISQSLEQGADWTPAEKLAWAEYTGPTGLGDIDAGAYQKAIEDISRIYGMYGDREKATAFDTIIEGIQGATAGLTPGEARFEALGAQKSPEFQKSAETLSKSIGSTREALGQAATQARLIGEARAEQEKDIREKARASVLGRQEKQYEKVAQRASSARTAEEEYLTKLERFLETGDLADLNAIPVERFAFNPEALATPARKALKEAGATWAGIWEKYPDIADVPPLVPNISEKGWQGYTWSPEWMANIKGKKRWEEPGVHEQAVARQKELEQAGFGMSPETGGPHFATIEGAENAPTKYGLYQPLYFGRAVGGMWQPKDVREYLYPSQKAGTTSFIPETPKGQLEVFSSEEEKRIFNTINQIMHFLDSDIADSFPYAAAQIGANLERFMNDEQQDLESRKERLSKAQSEWLTRLRDTRMEYKRNRRKRKWGQILGGGAGFSSLLAWSPEWINFSTQLGGNLAEGKSPLGGIDPWTMMSKPPSFE